MFRSHSPKKDENLSLARKLQQGLQQEANRDEVEDRLTNMVAIVEEEMKKARSSTNGEAILDKLRGLKLIWGEKQASAMATQSITQSS